MRALSTGTLEAIDVPARTIRVGGITYRLAVPWLLKRLKIGQGVTVAWDQAAGPESPRIAQAVSIERT